MTVFSIIKITLFLATYLRDLLQLVLEKF